MAWFWQKKKKKQTKTRTRTETKTKPKPITPTQDFTLQERYIEKLSLVRDNTKHIPNLDNKLNLVLQQLQDIRNIDLPRIKPEPNTPTPTQQEPTPPQPRPNLGLNPNDQIIHNYLTEVGTATTPNIYKQVKTKMSKSTMNTRLKRLKQAGLIINPLRGTWQIKE